MRSDTGPFAIIPLWVVKNVNPTAVVVYAGLASYADNDSGKCFPSHKALGDSIGLSIATVKRALRELADLGAVVKRERVGSDGAPTSNEYTLIRVEPVHLRSQVGSDLDGGGVESDPRSDQVRPDVGSDVTYELDPYNYTHLTKPNELDIAPKQVLDAKQPKIPFDHIEDSDGLPTVWKKLEVDVSKRDLVFEALCDVCQIDWKEDLTKRGRGAINQAVKELKEVNAQPHQIIERAKCFRLLWPTIPLTPSALANRWAECHPSKVASLRTNRQRDDALEKHHGSKIDQVFSKGATK